MATKSLAVCVVVLTFLAAVPSTGHAVQCLELARRVTYVAGDNAAEVALAIPKATNDAARVGNQDFAVHVALSYISNQATLETADSGRVSIKDTTVLGQPDATTVVIQVRIPVPITPNPNNPHFEGTAELLPPTGPALCVAQILAPAPHIYVANAASNSVSVIHALTHSVVATVPVGATPFSVVVNGNAYVTNTRSNSVSVIDAVLNTVVATVPVGSLPTAMAIAQNRVYVANSGANTVSVINTIDNTVEATLVVGRNPSDLSMAADALRLYVTNGGSNSLSVIDVAINSVIATIPVGRAPIGVAGP